MTIVISTEQLSMQCTFCNWQFKAMCVRARACVCVQGGRVTPLKDDCLLFLNIYGCRYS